MKSGEKKSGQQLFCVSKTGQGCFLARELEAYGLVPQQYDQGWVFVDSADLSLHEIALLDICFAQRVFCEPREINASSVGQLSGAISDFFMEIVRSRRIDSFWPAVFTSVDEQEGLSQRVKNVKSQCMEKIKKRISRVVNLATDQIPYETDFVFGLFVHFLDFTKVIVSGGCLFGGQRRMKMDSHAPSRSYLKIEEAFAIMGKEPSSQESVADLGAAPGGWTYSALKRGAYVSAVDNGALKKGAFAHDQLTHIRESAFIFKPPENRCFDWLFCDMIENPYLVIELITQWQKNSWCRNFVANLKVGRLDPIPLLEKIRAPQQSIRSRSRWLKIRQLYHDREEITMMGENILLPKQSAML